MKRLSLFIFFVFATLHGYAQNIVQNGSFEDFINCPIANILVSSYVNHWREYGLGTPDYYHACNTGNNGVPTNFQGYQAAAQGSAYVGIFIHNGSINTTEYVATSFQPLIVGAQYQVSLSASLCEKSNSGVNGLGVYFYKNGPLNPPIENMFAITPQVSYAGYGPITDKINWTRLSGSFFADSTYEHLVIGGFLSISSQTMVPFGPPIYGSYYYIDSVVVRRLPAVGINFTSPLFCSGDTIQVSYTKLANLFSAGNTFTLQLSGPTGNFSPPVNIGSVVSTVSGFITGVLPAGLTGGTGYRLRIVSTNMADTSFDNGANIQIKPLPAVVASSNTPVCEGNNSINLAATALSGSSYSWSGPSFTSLLQNPGIASVSPANSGDYIVTATLNGCISKDTTSVLVKPKPVTPAANNNGPLCPGDTLHLTSSTVTTGVSYSWAGPVSVPAVQNPAIINVSSIHDGVYTVTATLNGCPSTPANTTVVIKPVPAKPTTTNNSPVCTGGILNLFANSSTSGVSYDWTGPNSFTSTLQNPTIDPVPANGGGKYSATATLNGCTSEADTTVAVVNTVTYLGAYASPNDTICAGDKLTVVTVPVNGGTSPQFQWYKNNAQIAGATNLTYPTTTAITGDSFYCRMIAGNVCNTPITLFSDKIGITVLPKTPAPSVTISSNPAKPLPGNAVTFTASSTNGGSNPQLQWQRNGADIVGATASTWSANNLNPYDKISVKLTVAEPCPEANPAYSDTITVNFPVGIQNIVGNSSFHVYPNPNDGHFTIKGNAGAKEVQVQILNAIGQVVYIETIPTDKGMIEITPAIQLAKGVYIVSLHADGYVQRVKILAE